MGDAANGRMAGRLRRRRSTICARRSTGRLRVTELRTIMSGPRLRRCRCRFGSNSSLHAEARLWAHQALNIAGLDARHEMMLQIALGTVLLKTEAASDVIGAAFRRGLELAELGGDTEHSLRALYGLYVEALHANKYKQARGFAERFRALAEQIGSRADLRVGDRLIGTSTHYLGQTAQARMRLELWLKERSDLAQRPRESRFGFDQNVMGFATLARVLALQGELDRALELAEEAIDEARS